MALHTIVVLCMIAVQCCYADHGLWVINNGKCFTNDMGTTLVSRASAEGYCNGYLGNLATIESAAENSYVVSWAAARVTPPIQCWLAYNDIATEGVFVDSNNLPMSAYTNWAPGEPLNDATKNCVGMDCITGLWYMYSCSATRTAICTKAPFGSNCPPEPPYYCFNGGTCSVDPLNTCALLCTCPAGWDSLYCDYQIDECLSIPCLNGAVCTDLLLDVQCTCAAGYTDFFCSTDIDECVSNPCTNGATCTDLVNGYTCTCELGWTNTHCEIEIDECISNPCDQAATCVDYLALFVCICPPYMTGTLCNATDWDAMFGTANLSQLVPTMMTPGSQVDGQIFAVATLDEPARMRASWDESIFDWATYEGRALDMKKDFTKWNDPALGNCFTFNHPNSSHTFIGRRAGRGNGLLVSLQTNSHDYAPWVLSSGFRVYIHHRYDGVFLESVGYFAAPGFYTTLSTTKEVYDRLDKPHSECINEPSEVNSYYYTGNYSSDACVRSCYQDELAKSEQCGCMDPRFAIDSSKATCPLPQRTCIEEFTKTNNDPIDWAECNCPLPCQSTEYSARASKAKFKSEITKCGSNATCNAEAHDERVMIEVYLASLSYKRYVETPKMGVVDLLAQTGGLLGILASVSVFTMSEFVVLGVRLTLAAAKGLTWKFFKSFDYNQLEAYMQLTNKQT